MVVQFRRKGWSFGVALVAAYLLVLQAAVGALALGAGTMQLDAFGNPLCITSVDHAGKAGGTADHARLPDCCTLGCSTVSAAVATQPQPFALFAPLPAARIAVGHRLAVEPFRTRHGDPGRPRGPPLTI